MNAGPDQHRRVMQQTVRWASLVAAVLILVVARDTRWPALVPGISPFVTLASVLAGRAIWAVAPAGLGVMAVAAIRRRWFCRWVCPSGLIHDGASHFGRRAKRSPRTLPPVGSWVLWITLGGALLGYPVLLWLDPLAMFSGAFSVTRAVAWYGIVPAVAVLVLSFLWPGAWCARVCPLGALQESTADIAKRLRGILTRRPSDGSGRPLARRTVLGVVVGAASASVMRVTHGRTSKPIRPPGATGETEFRGLCVRCGNCVRTCPTHVIEPDLGRHGVTSLLTPTVSFKNGYCREDCVQCTTVCPSGALRPLSIEDKSKAPIGLARVDMSICLLGEDRDCAACRNWCPHEAVRYVFSEVEYTLTPVIDSAKCSGCGACEAACPTSPRKAIVVVANNA